MAADPTLTLIEEAAATWIIEQDRGLSHPRQREFTHWLNADPRHAAAYRALADTWQLIGESHPQDKDTLPLRAERRRLRGWWAVTLAAAATVAMAYWSNWAGLNRHQAHPAAPFAVTAVTEVGMLRQLDLPDGSHIQLNTDSAVDVHYTRAERRVTLVRGEAHFAVAQNANRPFIVSAADLDVRVVGTVFNVRLSAEAIDVLVTEGKVRVAPAPAAESAPPSVASDVQLPELTAGQKISIGLPAHSAPRAALVAKLSPADIQHALAWQSRRLDFDAAPLAEIVAEINRYNRHKLVISDPRLDRQQFGGSFPAGDHRTFVRMLETSFGVVAERHGDETRLRLKER